MFGLSDFLTFKVLAGIAVVVAAGGYAFWRGWKGLPLGDAGDNDKPRK